MPSNPSALCWKGTAYTVIPWIFWTSAQLSTAASTFYLKRNNGHFTSARRCCWAPRTSCPGWWPGVRGVGQGRAAGKPSQTPGCFLPDMLVVAAEELVDVKQEDKVLGLLQIGLLACTLGAVERATTAIGCDVSKPINSSLHSERVKIWKSDGGFFNINQNNKYWKKKSKQSSITWFLLEKNTWSLCVSKTFLQD